FATLPSHSCLRFTSLFALSLFKCYYSIVLPHLYTTLFPYTTLFRSPWPGSGTTGAGHRMPDVIFTGPSGRLEGPLKITSGIRCPDRKSTRLNSSHVKISYAVFCLKKKISKYRI